MIEQYVSPEELKRLLSTLLVVVLGIALFGLFAFIVVPGLRNANKPPRGSTIPPIVGQTGWLDPTEYPPEKGYVIPPVDPATVMRATPALVQRGKALFEQNCAPCHGNDGRGDGPAAATLVPRPRDFMSPQGWVNGYRMEGIYKTLEEGIPGSAMSSWEYLSPKDRMALVHYVQSLGGFSHGPEDPTALAALAKQFGSTEVRVPNRIPVSTAMRRLEDEARRVAPLAVPVASSADHGAALASGIVAAAARAALTLARAPGWRESPAALAKAIVPGAPANGFAVSAATLTPDDWAALHGELLKIAPR